MVELATAIAVSLMVVAWHRRLEVGYRVSVFILVFQALSLGSALFLRRECDRGPQRRARPIRTSAASIACPAQRNVIHIVLDTTQGAMVQDLFQSDLARYSQIFDGFTLFSQAMGRYPSTYPSVSVLT